MLKKFSTLVLVGLLAVPTVALADSLEDRVAALEESSESWDKAARIHWSGDFRVRMDYLSADAPAYYNAFPTTAWMAGGMIGPAPLSGAATYDNDTAYTNRLRINMRTKVMENVEVKARLAMYKFWGMQSNVVDPGQGGGPFILSSMAFDGSVTRSPQDSTLRVDRVFMNWNNIGDMPIWFSIGRRPVTDGPPAHIRMGVSKMATPVSYMDYPFDGLSLGYAYENLFGIEDLPGRVRFCYGRGFEDGPTTENDGSANDVDFAGISWDVFKKGDRFFNFQSFAALNMFNVPGDVVFPNPMEIAGLIPGDGILDRANLGDIYHTSAVYMSKFANLHYFAQAGWSRTEPRGYDEMGNSLLISGGAPLETKDGYSVYVGARYDLDDAGVKLGAEVNWADENWVSFTPGHDDLYASKLATRGTVFELYGIFDLPAGEAISSLSRAFVRLGYQHYEYDYTGSGFWLGAPVDMDQLASSFMNMQFYTPIESMDQVYVTFESWF